MNIEQDNIIIEKYVDRFIKSFHFLHLIIYYS